jgi:hypothetical protein
MLLALQKWDQEVIRSESAEPGISMTRFKEKLKAELAWEWTARRVDVLLDPEAGEILPELPLFSWSLNPPPHLNVFSNDPCDRSQEAAGMEQPSAFEVSEKVESAWETEAFSVGDNWADILQKDVLALLNPDGANSMIM